MHYYLKRYKVNAEFPNLHRIFYLWNIYHPLTMLIQIYNKNMLKILRKPQASISKNRNGEKSFRFGSNCCFVPLII